MIKHCLIVANGSIIDHDLIAKKVESADYVIAVDGGANHLQGLGLKANVYLGDFDSIDAKLLKKIEAENVELIKYPSRKDVTDSEIAIAYALKLKPAQISIIGVTGCRLDHTMSNLLLLKTVYDHKIPCKIIDDHNEIYYLEDEISFHGKQGQTVSIVPLSNEMTGVTTRGMDYPLLDETLNFGSTRSISNIVSEEESGFEITSGFGLVLLSRD